MARFIALSASGISFGAIVAIVAAGFLVLYKATGVVNFAHGDLMTAGAYVAVWGIDTLRLPILVAYLLALVVLWGVGMAMERLVYAPLRHRSMMVIVIGTLGAATVIRYTLAVWQGSTPLQLQTPVGTDSVWHLFGAAISYQRTMIVIVAAVVLGFLYFLFYGTSFGRQVRALATDRETAQLQGIRVRRMAFLAFGLSAALAALAGILIAPLSSVDLTLGFDVMLTAFAAAILGGFGNLTGVIVGSLIIGLVQQLLGGYVFLAYSSALPFVVMLIIMVIRPAGLFSEDAGARL
jgi:branched-chain amino acid transport system permease protein